MKAAVYARRSHEQEGAIEEAKSVTVQVELARAYAAGVGNHSAATPLHRLLFEAAERR